MTFILVDRNAINANDRDGGDRPVIAVYTSSNSLPSFHRDVDICDSSGRVIGRFLSQSAKRPVNNRRPHVWFELDPEATVGQAVSS